MPDRPPARLWTIFARVDLELLKSVSVSVSVSDNSGVDQGCPLSTCGFSAAVDPVLQSVLAELCTHYDSGAKLFAYLDDWYLWIKPQCLLQTIAVITAATRSVNLALQSTKTQVWKGSCQDPIPPEFQDKVTLTLSCLGGHLQIHGDIEPSPVVLGEQATIEKTTQRFQRIATTFADLNAEGFNAQAVNDLLTIVGAASQHVLRMSFVPEQETRNFDRQVTSFWSRLIQRDIASPLFYLPLKHGGLGVGSAVQRHAAAPWRAWQSIISWQQPSHRIQTLSSVQHHDYEPNQHKTKHVCGVCLCFLASAPLADGGSSQ